MEVGGSEDRGTGRLFDVPITSQTTSGLTRSKKGDGSEVPKWLQRVSISVLVGAMFSKNIRDISLAAVDSRYVFQIFVYQKY